MNSGCSIRVTLADGATHDHHGVQRPNPQESVPLVVYDMQSAMLRCYARYLYWEYIPVPTVDELATKQVAVNGPDEYDKAGLYNRSGNEFVAKNFMTVV